MDKLLQFKKNIIKISSEIGEGHIPSAFSILDILWVLYNNVLKINPQDPNASDRDIFILSKGHASLGLYVILAKKGFFDEKLLDDFAKFNCVLGGHPDRNKIPGVEASTGSLGHGMPIAVGVALGQKISRSSNRTIVLIGDGESNEGTIWESAMLAAHHKLVNLTCIVDYNHSTDRALEICDMVSKFKSFGWNTLEIDGHDHNMILSSLSKMSDKPLAIIANTIKGKGIKSMENNPSWHHKSPNQEELNKFIEEIETKR